MTLTHRRFHLAAVLVILVSLSLGPALAAAQGVARTFAELVAALQPGDYLFVTPSSGAELWGRVVNARTGPEAVFSVVVIEKTATGSRTIAEPRVFRQDDVALVRLSDSARTAGAVVYPAVWERIDRLAADSPLRVELAGRGVATYRFRSITAETLTVVDESGASRVVSKSDIRRVERVGYSDPVGNGIGWGALIGAGTGFVMTAMAYALCDDTCDAPARVPFFLSTMAFTGGIGAVSGWAIDKLHKGTELLFPVAPGRPGSRSTLSITPVVGLSTTGVSIAVRF